MAIHLRKITLQTTSATLDGFPFNVAAVRNLAAFEFKSFCTIFAGENGSGKSTLLEGIAIAVGSISIGSEEISQDRTLELVGQLADARNLVWNKRTHRGF